MYRRTIGSMIVLTMAVVFCGIGLKGCEKKAQAAEAIIIEDPVDVPELREEIIEVEPSNEHIWIPGYWEREAGKWTWSKGHWGKPPHKKAHWVKGHWIHHEGKWQWHKGHWAVVPFREGYIVDEILDIPVRLKEVQPPKPTYKDHWVPGYWEWNGTWHWIHGHWTNKPHPNAEWVAGHWEKHGKGGWRWIAGHWNER